ncbi:MAG: CHAT domain-containing protein [Desulfobacterales bacterium]
MKKNIFLLQILFLLLLPVSLFAEISLDGSIGNAGQISLSGPDYHIRPEYGHQSGTNLFHSFLRFGISAGESATFSGPSSVQNIISRVTGGEISRIDGLLRSVIPEANLYFLNPAGVIFGSGAQLDIGGGFHVSTADYLRMEENRRFYSLPVQDEILSVAPPQAFGFLEPRSSDDLSDNAADDSTRSSIRFENCRLDFSGKTFSVIGGDICIADNSGLTVNGGQLNLVSTGSAGEVTLGSEGPELSGFSTMGNVLISGSEEGKPSEIDVRYGSIYIRSGSFVADNSGIFADIPYSVEEVSSAVFDIGAQTVELKNNAIFSTDTFGRADGADMNITASESVQISAGKLRVGSIGSKASGDAGSLHVQAPVIQMEEGSEIQSESKGKSAGNAGNVRLDASERLSVSDSTTDTYTTGVGNAGNVSINGGAVLLDAGTRIRAYTEGSGNAGEVSVSASASLDLRGDAGILTETGSTGNAGQILLEAPIIRLQENAAVSSSAGSAENAGNAGTIFIQTHSLVLSEHGSVSTETGGKGQAGDIEIQSGILAMNGASLSSASTAESGGGDAGTITVQAEDAIFLSSGAFFSTDAAGAGGGSISAEARNIISLSESEISTSVHKGLGNGGDIRIGNAQTGEPVFVTLNHSRVKANADGGDGGAIFVIAENYLKSADSAVEASSRRGNDGTVRIESPDTDISTGISGLPEEYPDASQWVQTPCAQRSAETVSRFVMERRDGIPLSFDDWRSSHLLLAHHHFSAHPDGKRLVQLIEKGDFPALIMELEKKQRTLPDAVLLSAAYSAAGYYSKAMSVLEERKTEAEHTESLSCKAMFCNAFGDLHLLMGNRKKAIEYIKTALDAARKTKDSVIIAAVLNHLGILRAVNGYYAGAIPVWEEGILLLRNAEEGEKLQAGLTINILRAEQQSGNRVSGFSAGDIESALGMMEKNPDDWQKAADLIALGILVLKNAKKTDDLPESISPMLEKAATTGESIGNPQIISWAYGLMGQYCAQKKQYAEALSHTRKAVFAANQGDYPEILYLWQRQLGKLFHETGDREQAIAACEHAVETLHPIRTEFFTGLRDERSAFADHVKPVYLELASLYLETSEQADDPSAKAAALNRAKATVESLKTAEVQDFFQDECIEEFASLQDRTSTASGQTALLYPLVLPDRLVLLLDFSEPGQQNDMIYIPVEVDIPAFGKSVRRFREALEEADEDFTEEAARLYDWLIRPAETELAARNIDTLLVSPDGPLRMIPFAALYDGERYLVETFAIGTVLSAGLTDVRENARAEKQILLNGLSQGKEDFSPLPHVRMELEHIQNLVKSRMLLDDSFTVRNLKTELGNGQFSFVHMATHTVFGKNYAESFLLTFDGRLSMNQLDQLVFSEKYKGNPLELLTLSACETALGDERSAFGLAGVALRSGAKSSLGTLWKTDDQAAFLTVEEFYRQMSISGLTKAKALQKAQIRLMHEKDYEHPVFWSPFLLIGNWL